MSKTGTTGLGRRALAALLTLTLATSGVPASAYAEAASQLGVGQSAAATAATDQQQTDDQSSSQGSDSTSASDSSSPSSDGASSASATTQSSSAASAAAATAEATSDSSDGSQQAVDIYSAYITTDAAGTKTTYAWKTTDTIWAWAKEKGASTAIDSSLLNYQWQVSDSKRGDFTDIPGATQQSLNLADYAGKYIRCHVSAKSGDSSYDTRARSAVTDASSDSITVQKVTLDATDSVKSGTAIKATATGTDGSDVSSKVTWSWYSSSDDSSTGTKIAGAASATYTPTSDQAGSYVYAVATVGSTDVKSTYIKVESEDAKAGAYDLTSVQVTSSNVDAHVGATLSATARYEYQGTYYSYETDVPDDAQVTYTWHASAADGTGDRTVLTQKQQGSTASTLELTDDLAGCQVWVEASASKTPATSSKLTVGARDTYSLKNVNLSPSTGTVVTGSTVSASVFAYNLSGTGTAVTDQKGVSVQWYVADSADADQDSWTALDGATGSTLQVPAEAAGKYLKAVATSGTSTAEATFDAKVVDANSLDGIVAKLSNEGYSGWKPSPTYGTDTNVNDMLLQHLSSLGVSTDGVTVSVKSASFEQTDEKATVGVGTGDSDNGAITYYSADPDAVGAYAYTRLQTIDQLTYVITRDGQSVEYVAKNVRIPWDQQKATELLQQKADQLSIGYADGDSADSLTQDATLPYKAGNPTSTWTSVSWTSDSDAVTVDGYGWDDYTAKPTRGSTDQDVTLTAKVSGLGNYGLPDDVSVTKTFKVTVKADPQKVQEATQELQASLDSGYTYDNVSAYQAGDSADHTGVMGDLVMPRPRKLGVDGKYYSVTYTSDNAAVTFNGYHAVVVRPLGSDTTVNLTCTVTSKENPEITASKTLSFTIKSVSQKDIDDELALMQKVEAAYKSALLGQGSDSAQSEPVTQNLSTFQKAYLDSEGNVAFARTKAEADAHTGIALTEVDGYQDMGPYDQARLFQSSDTNVVLNETLQLAWNADRSTSLSQYHAQPKYNTTVKISSKLTSERYGSYYQRYKDDSGISDSLKGKLAQLAATNVSAEVKVAGTSGKEAIQASGTIIGQDSNGVARTWA
ncbi:MAG: immunoglobulin-like domain-containing protein, partial [Atopobiaceae bacterium]